MTPTLLSVMLTAPAVFALSVLVATEPAVMLPLPEAKLIVPPVRVPADCDMVPVPVAVRVIVLVAVAFAPRAMLPFAAVDCKVKLLVEETTPVVLRLPAADKVNAPPVAINPEELRFVELLIVPLPNVPDTTTAPPELLTVADPVLF